MPTHDHAYYLIASTGQVLRLEPRRSYVCGRDEDADLMLADAHTSRRHAELRWENGSQWRITDLDSNAGTLVNDRPLTGSQPLQDRARIRIGDQTITFFVVDPDTDVETLKQEARMDPQRPGTSPIPSDGSTAARPAAVAHEQSTPMVDLATMLSQSGEDRTGQRFGNATLRCLLGHGCVAQVYRAYHETLETDVAVKVMRQTGTDRDEQNRKRFLREARIAATIQHPNVVQVTDAGLNDLGEAYLIMELVEGCSLGHLLKERGQMSVAEVSRYAPGIAAGLAAIHAHEVVHRDIKPDNILIAADGTPKISDLGMARREDDETIQRLTGTGVVLGTPMYMAPETVTDAHSSGPPADIYSFGVTLYQLMAGRPPVQGQTPYELMRAHLNGRWTPITDLVSDIDRNFAKVIHSCLDKNPAKRPDARTLAQSLSQFQRIDTTSYEARSGIAVAKGLRRSKSSKATANNHIKAVVIATVAVLVVVLIAVVLMKVSS